MRAAAGALALLAALGGPAAAEGASLTRTVEGVRFDLYAAREAVVVCVTPLREGIRLSGEYGVRAHWPTAEARAWGEPGPREVTTAEEYFPGPVLVRLAARDGARRSRLTVEAGACIAGDACVPLEAAFALAGARPRALPSSCPR